jgi:hypothetical protein
VLDWRVTFPTSVPKGKFPTVPTPMSFGDRHRKQATNLPFRAFLLGGTHGIASRNDRNASVNGGAALRLRVD